MSSTRTAPEDAPADEIAAALREARFVRLLTFPDGDHLAASGILARVLRACDVPFQVRVAAMPSVDATDDESVTVTVGHAGGDVTIASDTAASVTAATVADHLGGDGDPVLALAGTVAAGVTPGTATSASLLDAASASGAITRRPGVAVPTADLADGVAHSTLAHAPFSGDVTQVADAFETLALPTDCEDFDDDAHRRVASLVAIETAAAEDATARAATAVERVLRPYATPDGPFETLGGYADVLDAVARERPGTGIALALGHDAREPALAAWRDHARAAHAMLREATTGRYDGVFVARTDRSDDNPGRLGTAARLLRDFRSPEPVALVVDDGVAAAASTDDRDLGATMRDAVMADGLDGTVIGRTRRGEAQFDGELSTFITAFREALR